MKFGMMMHLIPLNLTGNQKFQNNDRYFNFDFDSVSKLNKLSELGPYIFIKTCYLSKNIQGSISKLAQSILLQRPPPQKKTQFWGDQKSAGSVPPTLTAGFRP